MQYRRLTREELEQFPEEFAMFLAVHGIDRKIWDEMKDKNEDEADRILDIFSDIIFEKALTHCDHLERATPEEWVAYHFGEKEAHMVALVATGENITLENGLGSDEIEKGISEGDLELYEGTKVYQKLREHEMFDILEQGAYMSDGDLYEGLKSLL